MTEMNTRASQQALDILCLGFVGILLGLALVFPSRIPDHQHTVTALTTAALLYGGVARPIVARLKGFAGTAVQTAAVLSLFSFLFEAVSGFQHVFIQGWMDEKLLSWEETITGTESAVLLERFMSRALTEWMMFSYVLYVPLLPLMAAACYRQGGRTAVTDYLLNLSLANCLCYIGFIVFPVAGPLCYHPEAYTVPLEGGIFTWLGEWIRGNLHYPGGCLPSPHCAATTVMIAMLYRYDRKLFGTLLPALFTIYFATVYGRYHYVWDSLAGLAVALLVLKFSPLLVQWLSNRTLSSPMQHSGRLLVYNTIRKEGAS